MTSSEATPSLSVAEQQDLYDTVARFARELHDREKGLRVGRGDFEQFLQPLFGDVGSEDGVQRPIEWLTCTETAECPLQCGADRFKLLFRQQIAQQLPKFDFHAA